MPTTVLTDRRIAGFAARATRVEWFDASFPGLAVRVTPKGTKTFVYLYRRQSDKQFRRLTLGTYPDLSLADARDRARTAVQATSVGGDPATDEQDSKTHTVDALGDLYLERHAKRVKKSWREDARMIRNELRAWKGWPVRRIRRRDVRDLLDAIVDRGAPITANRVLGLIRKMLNFAIDREWIESNPAARMAAPAPERPRSRAFSDDELRQIVAHCQTPAPDTIADRAERRRESLRRAWTLFRLLTAQRGGEVLAMRWADVVGDVWTIPGAVAKNKLEHRVPLTKWALTILADLRAADQDAPADAFVFRGIRGQRERGGALRALNLDDARSHDLRRTAASRMAAAGVDRLVIAKVLNHVDRSVTAIYDRHGYDAEKRDALTTWARVLDTMTNPRRAKVLSIRRRRA